MVQTLDILMRVLQTKNFYKMTKRLFFLLLTAFIATPFFGCKSNSSSATDSTQVDTVINQNPTQLQQDSAVLSDDSATVKTAVGVQDEEQNAKEQVKKDAEKLKADSLKSKQ